MLFILLAVSLAVTACGAHKHIDDDIQSPITPAVVQTDAQRLVKRSSVAGQPDYAIAQLQSIPRGYSLATLADVVSRGFQRTSPLLLLGESCDNTLTIVAYGNRHHALYCFPGGYVRELIYLNNRLQRRGDGELCPFWEIRSWDQGGSVPATRCAAIVKSSVAIQPDYAIAQLQSIPRGYMLATLADVVSPGFQGTSPLLLLGESCDNTLTIVAHGNRHHALYCFPGGFLRELIYLNYRLQRRGDGELCSVREIRSWDQGDDVPATRCAVVAKATIARSTLAISKEPVVSPKIISGGIAGGTIGAVVVVVVLIAVVVQRRRLKAKSTIASCSPTAELEEISSSHDPIEVPSAHTVHTD